MNNGPLPTRLVFLSDLPTQARGTKVRFLGCVARYAVSTGVLELEHASPLRPHMPTVALVDVNLILETLEREDTQVGAWVNVMGYMEGVLKEEEEEREQREGQGKTRLAMERRTTAGKGRSAVRVHVQAIMLWSAGGLKIGEYERILEERLKLEKGS
ncbi:MAG: hypothetical protein ASARMPREDX12_002225 [Alectoria sarmentosa]|nr:MAG: hypothetical protein ASARMPREDX12_002225 [Alectoria sarmentosa]